MPVLRFRSPGPEATQAAAHELAAGIDEHGLVLGLVGALGTGKTLFVKGLAAGMGIDPSQVSSPTFVIAQQTVAASGRRLAHVDLYRVSSLGELEATGFLDLLEPGAVVAVEWADRLPAALPADHLELRLERGARPELRSCRARAGGAIAAAALARWRVSLADAGVVGLE
ncbi:MAG: tRNA (adenosine(37)-N6)-threonylcarbamoyltransferase complex ATPase subunit type 1 TsaE [Myxococcota bacterium]